MKTSGIWLFSRYEDVMTLLKEKETISKQISLARAPEKIRAFDLTLLNQDPPTHTRLRDVIRNSFTAKKIAELEPKIKQIVQQLILNMSKQTEVDFITDFARPLPIAIIAEMIGIPPSDHNKIYLWSKKIASGFDSVVLNPEIYQQQTNALEETNDYFDYLVHHYRQNPSDNLICLLLKAFDNSEIDHSEMLTMIIVLLIGGHETTIQLLGSGLLTLLHHPEQFELLKKQPEYMASSIEEMLRFESPLQRTTFRITTQDFEINGKHIAAGEQVAGILGAANRDPSQFSEPHKFDITRSPNAHLAFGLGIHACLGSFLARTEARIAFSEILANLPNIRLASQAPQWNCTTIFRGLQSLPILC
ncbi:hypothetical protein BCS42_08040 [Crenothrix sp. D3]|nr:hypothetical protein BCS42_08040 [Crenothrix sp. D3]